MDATLKVQKSSGDLLGPMLKGAARSHAWAMANVTCTDDTHPVPDPPDLFEALNQKKNAMMEGDKRVIARIKTGNWTPSPSDLTSSGRHTGTLRPDARPRPKPGSHPEHPYECLVFKGGGAKGSIYPGAVRALEDAGVMCHIKRFAGASAGALVAALLAAGLSADQLFIELATTDLQPLVLDSSTPFGKLAGLVKRFGMHPGNGLYQHIGLLFYKYLGSADVTFKELYDQYGVELAVAVTNISRASVELLHVKTAPDYPIRKAVRASMSLPVALHPCRDRNIHSVLRHEGGTHSEPRSKNEDSKTPNPTSLEDPSQIAGGVDPMEYYVDGGVLNNYPIDSFDGWWLSMEKEDAFFRKVIGEGGHKNYVERFGSYDAAKGVREVNPKTMGFRLASANEPDAMHSRLGNDALELKVRHCVGASLPNSTLANKYAMHRHDLTNAAKDRLKLEKDLRASMTWIKSLRDTATTPTEATLEALLRDHQPPQELLEMLDITSEHLDEDTDPCAALAELLRHHHFHANAANLEPANEYVPTRHELDCVLQHGGWAKVQVEALFANTDLDDEVKLDMIQRIVRGAISGKSPTTLEACDALEALLEAEGEDIMKRLTGMAPKHVGSFGTFVGRMIEAIQMTNDERVQTKENYSRTCMLNTEYVGTMDFKLEESDHYFLWRKGYLTASMWLEKRTKKIEREEEEGGKGNRQGAEEGGWSGASGVGRNCYFLCAQAASAQ